mgnify:CR=1 FL=1
MKIIGIENNFIAAHNNATDKALPQEPVIFMKPDSALLKDGKPFFIPDFSEQVDYETELVVRINRLGKNIAERFAHRYYDAMTLGIDFFAADLLQQQQLHGLPWEISKGFDGSAALGEWTGSEAIGEAEFCLQLDGKTVQKGNTADWIFHIDNLIEYLSQFYTLRQGDLIYTGCPCPPVTIHIGQRAEGYLNGVKRIALNIK